MSWQDYVDKQLLASRCVTKAAIAGHDGNVWAKSENFEVSLIIFISAIRSRILNSLENLNVIHMLFFSFKYLLENKRIMGWAFLQDLCILILSITTQYMYISPETSISINSIFFYYIYKLIHDLFE